MKAVPRDTSGNIPGTKPRVDFEVGQAGPPDTEDPSAVINQPGDDSVVPGPNVTFSGTASDNEGLDEVFTVIRDKNTGLYLQAQ